MSYFDESTLPLPFCPGCGHFKLLEAVDKALERLGPDPAKVVIVTDIGCHGLSDKHFITSAFHGLHGRSITYGTGLKMADPDLDVIVLLGDGGCTIGGNHLINAAKRNVGIKAVVFNNFNFGMTGGQHSATTPQQGVTTSTPFGNLEKPLDLCSLVKVARAPFVARSTVFDKDLVDILVEGFSFKGFAFFDIWELCTAYYVPRNRLSKAGLYELMESFGFPRGVLNREERREFSEIYSGIVEKAKNLKPKRLDMETEFENNLSGRLSLSLAGSAGQKVKSTSSILGRAAVLSGLWVTQRDDFPITVLTGHSVAEIILSPERIEFFGVPSPDITLVISKEGLWRTRATIERLPPGARVYALPGMEIPSTKAEVETIAFPEDFKPGKEYLAAAVLAWFLKRTGLFPLESFIRAVELTLAPELASKSIEAIKKAV